MIEFLLFCIATIGMTSIITQGVIFQPFRLFFGHWAENIHHRREEKAQKSGNISRRSLVEWFNELINCAQCTGFWCGLFCGLFLISSNFFKEVDMSDDLQVVNRILMLFCCGVGGSFLAFFFSNVNDWVFYRKMNALRQLEEQDIILAQHRASMKDDPAPEP